MLLYKCADVFYLIAHACRVGFLSCRLVYVDVRESYGCLSFINASMIITSHSELKLKVNDPTLL